jgi:hypothetical protein
MACPIRVILNTTQRQDVMISGGLSRLNNAIYYTPNCEGKRPDTVGESPSKF